MATPLMEQYLRIKDAHQEEILFFRMGDFYEMFFDDAKVCSRVLGIALTARSKGEDPIPMAGVPHHSAETYIQRLLKSGHRVAICEQTSDPSEAKGIVDREVVRVITPGTLIEEEALLDQSESNYLAAVIWNGTRAGLSWIDLSTGHFFLEDLDKNRLADELERIRPAECLVPGARFDDESDHEQAWVGRIDGMVTPVSDWNWERQNAYKALTEHFETANLAGFGCDESELGICAAGAVITYLRTTQRSALSHIHRLESWTTTGRMELDWSTRRSLELARTIREGKREGTLLWVLDRTCTPMGARLLSEWTLSPLCDLISIQQRQDAVTLLFDSNDLRDEIRGHLDTLCDVERVTARLGAGRANARDLVSLANSLGVYPDVRKTLDATKNELFGSCSTALDGLGELQKMIGDALDDDPPAALNDGGLFREGFHKELDELRALAKEGKGWLAQYQAEQAERTGIPTLKIGYNKVFGYYLEVTNANKDKVPADYVRKQTLKNSERYITDTLKQYESKVLSADERAKDLEYSLFVELRDQAAGWVEKLLESARALATVDTLTSLADVAVRNRYVRPELDDTRAMDVSEGRHPVLEQISDEPFIPNDIQFDERNARTLLITGPNMAGKSTYIRQTALIVLMAQMGGYVPAASARIGLVDRIFTRVGASDELHRGASTFMVEMNETANILNHATKRSLIVLDEIGRGTSTYDGLSIAWAVTEYLHHRISARTMFATHYHELTELTRIYKGVKNLHVEVREWGDEIVFLHRIEEGGTDKSYGIHVARLAGIPKEAVVRAREILANLEEQALDPSDQPKIAGDAAADVAQLSLFGSAPLEDFPQSDGKAEKLKQELDELNLNELSPIQALNLLARWKADQADQSS